jgi:hypothetical protein
MAFVAAAGQEGIDDAAVAGSKSDSRLRGCDVSCSAMDDGKAAAAAVARAPPAAAALDLSARLLPSESDGAAVRRADMLAAVGTEGRHKADAISACCLFCPCSCAPLVGSVAGRLLLLLSLLQPAALPAGLH